MDNVFEKLSVFDFFNLIFTGSIFLIGLEFMGIDIHTLLASLCSIDITKEDNTIDFLFYLVVALGVCYVVGSCIQQLGGFFQRNEEIKAISSLLKNSDTAENSIKFKIYVNQAKELFNKKGIGYNNTFTDEQCRYFFAYCVYHIQVREYDKKPEKMRAIHGISNMLSTCFALLPFIGWIIQLVNIKLINLEVVENISLARIGILMCIYFTLAIVFWFRMRTNIRYRIRMILGIYEASNDMT